MRVSMRDRKNGSFQFVVSRGFDADGTRLRDYIEFRGSRTEAKKELTRLQHELDRGMYVTPARYTVAQYLEEWLESAAPRLSARTLERYDAIVRRHLIPALGSVKLQELTPLQIERYYAAALEGGRLGGAGGGLSASTVLYHHRVLHTALDWATRKNLLARNVADNVDPPRVVRPEMHALDEDQTAAVLDLIESNAPDLYLPALVAVSTGMRRGELLALRWSDVDLDGLTVSVGRSLQETKAGGLAFKEPKNGRTRGVGISQDVAAELRAHRKAQTEHRLSLGVAYTDQGLVFPALDGSPMNPHVLSRKFDRFRDRETAAARKRMAELKRTGKAQSTEHEAAAAIASDLGSLRWHDWRHSYASQQLRAGEQVLVVSKALGHATTAFTMDVYGHVLPGEQVAAAARHSERIAAARERRRAAGAGK